MHGVSGGSHPGSSVDPLAEVRGALTRHFDQVPARASVSFLGVEPIEILRFDPVPGQRAYVSLGMARHAMTGSDEPVLRGDGPRAELMLQLRDPTDTFADVWRRLAVLAAAPAVEGVVYTSGMSADLGEPFAAGSWCTGGVVSASAIEDIPTTIGAVSILQILPATPTELAWARVRGSTELEKLWHAQQVDLLDLTRPAVILV